MERGTREHGAHMTEREAVKRGEERWSQKTQTERTERTERSGVGELQNARMKRGAPTLSTSLQVGNVSIDLRSHLPSPFLADDRRQFQPELILIAGRVGHNFSRAACGGDSSFDRLLRSHRTFHKRKTERRMLSGASFKRGFILNPGSKARPDYFPPFDK